MKISVNKILEKMPKDLNKIEKVRYIYLKLGEIFSYQREYFYIPDRRVTKDIYEEAVTIDKIEKGDYQNKIMVTCRQISDVLQETINKLQEEGISAKLVGYEPKEENHVAVLTTIDGVNYYMDLYADLYRIQKGIKTQYFAPSKELLRKEKIKNISIGKELERVECKTLEDEIKVADEKLGYSKNGLYMDDAMAMMKQEMQEEENWKKYIPNYDKIDKKEKDNIIFKWKIDFMFKYLKNNFLEKDKMGVVELNGFYKKLYYSILTDKEKDKYSIRKIDIHVKDNEEETKEGILYEIGVEKENLYYIYNENIRGFEQKTKEELKDLREKGNLEYDSDFIIPEFEKYKEDDGISK